MSEKETGQLVADLRAEIVRTVGLDILHHEAAETIERLQAELAALKAGSEAADRLWRKSDADREKTALALAIQVEQLRECVKACSEYRTGHPAYEYALALSTAPADKILRQHDAKVIEPLWNTIGEIIGCFDAAYAEGLTEVLAETTDERLKDLVERRLMFALYAAQGVESPRALIATPEENSNEQ